MKTSLILLIICGMIYLYALDDISNFITSNMKVF